MNITKIKYSFVVSDVYASVGYKKSTWRHLIISYSQQRSRLSDISSFYVTYDSEVEFISVNENKNLASTPTAQHIHFN